MKFPPSDALLPSLLVLYDLLNDDDADIREISAETTSKLFKASLAPPTANRHIRKILLEYYSNSPAFAWNIACRMTMTPLLCIDDKPVVLSSAQKLFSSASLKSSEGVLFAKEKSNLWIDEVCEARRWSKMLTGLSPKALGITPLSTDENCLFTTLLTWATEAITFLNKSIQAYALRSTPEPLVAIPVVICSVNGILDYYDANIQSLRVFDTQSNTLDEKSSNTSWGTAIKLILLELEEFTRSAMYLKADPTILSILLERESMQNSLLGELKIQTNLFDLVQVADLSS
jgi:hypothetical protein